MSFRLMIRLRLVIGSGECCIIFSWDMRLGCDKFHKKTLHTNIVKLSFVWRKSTDSHAHLSLCYLSTRDRNKSSRSAISLYQYLVFNLSTRVSIYLRMHHIIDILYNNNELVKIYYLTFVFIVYDTLLSRKIAALSFLNWFSSRQEATQAALYLALSLEILFLIISNY